MKIWQALFVQDVMPDAAIDLGMLRNKRAIQLSRWMARNVYNAADEIYTLGEGMQRKIAEDTLDTGKISVVSNTIDGEELSPRAGQGDPFREKVVRRDAFAVVHAGNMGKKQDLELLLRTADRLRTEEDIQFFVFGDGAVKDDFLRQRSASTLENVSWFPLQPRELLPHMLFGADVVLVSQLPSVLDTVVPLKLITAMAAGAMIVAACAPESETAKLVKESGGGVTVPASDDRALAEVLVAIRSGEIDTGPYRKAARKYALEKFDRTATYRAARRSDSSSRTTESQWLK
jgi:colanic acid biosynthesis glycosyl transferase WcaI